MVSSGHSTSRCWKDLTQQAVKLPRTNTPRRATAHGKVSRHISLTIRGESERPPGSESGSSIDAHQHESAARVPAAAQHAPPSLQPRCPISPAGRSTEGAFHPNLDEVAHMRTGNVGAAFTLRLRGAISLTRTAIAFAIVAATGEIMISLGCFADGTSCCCCCDCCFECDDCLE